jgi:hypothetical protein
MTNGWGPVERDRSNGDNGAGDGGPLVLNGVTYAKGLGAHAPSDVRYALGACSVFTAQVGVDDIAGTSGSLVFQVWVDGTPVGGHRGGYLPFTLDVTDAMVGEVHELVVRVRDVTDTSWHSRGKQTLERGGIWYTPQSGIWQTVWMEPVARDHVVERVAQEELVLRRLRDTGASVVLP